MGELYLTDIGNDTQLDIIYGFAGLVIAGSTFVTKPAVEDALAQKTSHNKLAAYFWSGALGACLGGAFKIVRTEGREELSGVIAGAIVGLIGGALSEEGYLQTIGHTIVNLAKSFFIR